MSSSYDLYKGTARSKRKAKIGESSQASAKKAKTTEQEVVPEVPPTVPVVEVEESPSRATAPEARVSEEPAVEEADEPPSIFEPVGEATVEDVRQVFEKTITMTTERAHKLASHRKYSKSASSFLGYNYGQAFSRGLNDITMVISLRNVYLAFLYLIPFLIELSCLFRGCAL